MANKKKKSALYKEPKKLKVSKEWTETYNKIPKVNDTVFSNHHPSTGEKGKGGLTILPELATHAIVGAKKMWKRIFNHPEWYMNVESPYFPIGINYANDAAGSLFPEWLNTASEDNFTQARSSSGHIAIIENRMALVLDPEDGRSATDSYMIHFADILSAASGRSANYSINEVKTYVSNSRAVLAAVCQLVHAYTACFTVSASNTKIRKFLLHAFGLRKETASSDIRDTISALLMRVAKIMPISGDLYERTFWLFANSFSDTNSRYSTITVNKTSDIGISRYNSMEDTYETAFYPLFKAPEYVSSVPSFEGFTNYDSEASSISIEQLIGRVSTIIDQFESQYLGSNLRADLLRTIGLNDIEAMMSELSKRVSADVPFFTIIFDERFCDQMANAKSLTLVVDGTTVFPTLQNESSKIDPTYITTLSGSAQEVVRKALVDYINLGLTMIDGDHSASDFGSQAAITRLASAYKATVDDETEAVNVSFESYGTEIVLQTIAHYPWLMREDATESIRAGIMSQCIGSIYINTNVDHTGYQATAELAKFKGSTNIPRIVIMNFFDFGGGGGFELITFTDAKSRGVISDANLANTFAVGNASLLNMAVHYKTKNAFAAGE